MTEYLNSAVDSKGKLIMKKKSKAVILVATILAVMVVIMIIVRTMSGDRGTNSIDINALSVDERAELDAEVEKAYNVAQIYEFPEDPINVEFRTGNGHYFIGFNVNVIEFSSDRACKTYDMSSGTELLELVCKGELRELDTISYIKGDGQQVCYEPEEWIVVNGSTKLYPPVNWEEIVAFLENLEEMAMN